MTSPRIAYAPHAVLGDLKTAELFVVTSLRLWIMPRSGPADTYPHWSQGLQQAGIGAAGVSGFDAVCRILAAAALRCLDIRPLACTRLGEDEAWFLSLLGLLQHDRIPDAERVLSGWCPPSAARLAIVSAQTFATALRARGLWLHGCPLEHTATPPAFSVLQFDPPRLH